MGYPSVPLMLIGPRPHFWGLFLGPRRPGLMPGPGRGQPSPFRFRGVATWSGLVGARAWCPGPGHQAQGPMHIAPQTAGLLVTPTKPPAATRPMSSSPGLPHCRLFRAPALQAHAWRETLAWHLRVLSRAVPPHRNAGGGRRVITFGGHRKLFRQCQSLERPQGPGGMGHGARSPPPPSGVSVLDPGLGPSGPELGLGLNLACSGIAAQRMLGISWPSLLGGGRTGAEMGPGVCWAWALGLRGPMPRRLGAWAWAPSGLGPGRGRARAPSSSAQQTGARPSARSPRTPAR